MSNLSGVSNGNSNVAYRRRHVKSILKKCWCGSSINAKLLKSESNPYRRYYRCSFESSNKLVDDHHFKWVDNAMVNETHRMSNSIERLEKQLMVFENKSLEEQNHEILVDSSEDGE